VRHGIGDDCGGVRQGYQIYREEDGLDKTVQSKHYGDPPQRRGNVFVANLANFAQLLRQEPNILGGNSQEDRP